MSSRKELVWLLSTLFLGFSAGQVSITALLEEPVQHGEGPFYDLQNDVLYFVDTFQAAAHRYYFTTKESASYSLVDHNSIAVIIPFGAHEDQFLVAADRNLYNLTWKASPQDEIVISKLLAVENDKPLNQFNDGKVDSKGRLWLGTLTRNEDSSVSPHGGSLYMFQEDKLKNYEVKITKTSISNGLAWSNDETYLYFVDSTPRRVFGYNYNEETGKISNEVVVFDLSKHPQLSGIPDGMTIDTNGHLWIALFGGHSIVNVNPVNGKIMRQIDLPVSYPTSVCFGGQNLDVLYVTTSRFHLNETQVIQEPLAGNVLAVTNLGVKGSPSNQFGTQIK